MAQRFVDAETGAQLGPALRHTDATCSASPFHPDGKGVVTGTGDGMVRRWSVPSPPRAGGGLIRRWLKERTGMELNDQGAVTMATACE